MNKALLSNKTRYFSSENGKQSDIDDFMANMESEMA